MAETHEEASFGAVMTPGAFMAMIAQIGLFCVSSR
jgi:hypothetical protein